MTKSILQIETVTEEEFTDKLLLGVKKMFDSFSDTSNKNTDQLFTREETAKFLSISLTTLWDYTRKGIVPAYRLGNKVRYKKSEVMEALKQMNNFKNQ